MSLAVLFSRAMDGLHAPEVTVEVHLANGLPSFTLVGLADTEVKEARERVRAALLNSGLEFPHNKRITVNLAPADLPKESGRFDLPIALGILAASGQIGTAQLASHEFAGELSLAGDLRPVRGALAMAAAVRRSGCKRTLVLPLPSAQEAALVEGLELRGARHLLDVVGALLPGADGSTLPVVPVQRPAAEVKLADLREVRGQAAAKRALEIAAAGGHNLCFLGPPGSGKSMMAARLPGILPPLTPEELLATSMVHSVAGLIAKGELTRARPFRSPHHSASMAALTGGGLKAKPGEVSLAHNGVLFLDELPEFSGIM